MTSSKVSSDLPILDWYLLKEPSFRRPSLGELVTSGPSSSKRSFLA